MWKKSEMDQLFLNYGATTTWALGLPLAVFQGIIKNKHGDMSFSGCDLIFSVAFGVNTTVVTNSS